MINTLSEADQRKWTASSGPRGELVDADPAVQAEYERLKALVPAKARNEPRAAYLQSSVGRGRTGDRAFRRQCRAVEHDLRAGGICAAGKAAPQRLDRQVLALVVEHGICAGFRIEPELDADSAPGAAVASSTEYQWAMSALQAIASSAALVSDSDTGDRPSVPVRTSTWCNSTACAADADENESRNRYRSICVSLFV